MLHQQWKSQKSKPRRANTLKFLQLTDLLTGSINNALTASASQEFKIALSLDVKIARFLAIINYPKPYTNIIQYAEPGVK